MGEIVNLKRERKRRSRDEDAAKAEANRVRFGRSKAEKRLSVAEQSLSERRIDGHRLDKPEDGPSSS